MNYTNSSSQVIQIEPFKIYNHNNSLELTKKIGLAVTGIGFLFLLISLTGISNQLPILFFFLSFGLIAAGSVFYFVVLTKEAPAGIKFRVEVCHE